LISKDAAKRKNSRSVSKDCGNPMWLHHVSFLRWIQPKCLVTSFTLQLRKSFHQMTCAKFVWMLLLNASSLNVDIAAHVLLVEKWVKLNKQKKNICSITIYYFRFLANALCAARMSYALSESSNRNKFFTVELLQNFQS
jgi:hypothetical protein